MAEHRIRFLPDWEVLLDAQIRGDFDNLEVFRGLCKLGDILRKAQDKGLTEVRVIFEKDGKTTIKEVV